VPRTSLFIPPCEPILRPRVPRGEAWLHEVKFDGYRMQIHKSDLKVRLFSPTATSGLSECRISWRP
jgi:ATP-dependent DNA ligase